MCKITSKLKIEKVVLVCIFILATALRFYGLNWDQEYHLHPDERWLTMVAEKISLPQNLNEFLSVDSPLNPKFFAYGSLPIYLLKFAGNLAGLLNPEFTHYNSLNLLGRMLSVFFDLGTLYLVFLLGRKIWNEKIGLLAAFFYAIAVFPIQNAHFYTVDTQLTFWIMLTLWLLIQISVETGHAPSLQWKKLIPVGITLGAALATKVTAVFLLPSILLAALMKVGLLRLLRSLRTSIYSLIFIFGAALFTFILLQPYALIDFNRFKSDILLQSQMSRDATVFPYTIQYVGTTPYIYQLKNLVLWGLGLPLGALGVLGVLWLTIQTIRGVTSSHSRKKIYHLLPTAPTNASSTRHSPAAKPLADGRSDVGRATYLPAQAGHLPLLSFFWLYFLVIGASAVKFMRYLLPLYPLLGLAAASLTSGLFTTPPKKNPSGFLFLTRRVGELAAQILVLGACILWTLTFMQIYTRPHTRVLASEWINQNIPTGSTLATEHWDDELPLWGGEKFQRVKLNLYDPDNAAKVDELLQKIVQADYIILSSNRLYDSIPKLPDRYPTTIHYYELLFAERLGFEKVAEFTSYPQFSIFNFQFSIRDSGADESFTVYDHPKVMIFKKEESLTLDNYQKLLSL